jgi:indolepyruvate decarboxylase
MKQSIGDFLLRRLEEAGIRHLFGVPGDYNLELLQQLQDTGALKWVGTCSELNASYAADGRYSPILAGAPPATEALGVFEIREVDVTAETLDPVARLWT